MKKIFKTDYILMIFFTLMFAMLTFYKIGSFVAPESFLCLNSDSSDKIKVVSTFDDPIYISKVYVYFGIKAGDKASISTSVNSDEGWEQINKVYDISGTFCWKILDVNRECRFFGLICEANQRDFSIGEIIFIDEKGEIIQPSNADSYTELFDEQEKFVEIPTYYNNTYFDEVYHGRTAYEFIHNLPIYENTHPPLGKTLIACGIRLFGMTPFGRRVVCGLFSVIMVPLFYIISKALFRRTAEASFAVILLLTEFMNYTLGRIATVDIIVAFFILAMFYFMNRFTDVLDSGKDFNAQYIWLLFCGIFAGLSIATKWTGFYALAGIAIIYFIHVFEYVGGFKGIVNNKIYLLKLFGFSVICFIVIPFFIYVISYLEFLPTHEGESLIKVMWDNSTSILKYHSKADEPHAYASNWYTWLFDLIPLLDSFTATVEGEASVIVTFINPLVCYVGLLALGHNVYICIFKKNKNARLLIVYYFAMLVPWIFITRTVFIYQYFVPSLLLILLITNSVSTLNRREEIMIALALVSIIIFILYFKVISGNSVSLDYVFRYLRWFPKWIYQ